MSADHPLAVLLVEDEALLAHELGYLVREAGCRDVGWAMDSAEALELARRLAPDLVLVDVHLTDGPTGVEAARRIRRECGAMVLFMTANLRRLPQDYAEACGAIGKPYSESAVKRAISWLQVCLRESRAPGPPPVGLTVAPDYLARWGAALAKAG